MIKHRLIHNDNVIEFLTPEEADDYKLTHSLDVEVEEFEEVVANDSVERIMSKIKQYQSLAPVLIRELYATNTINGITLPQSDEMFDECLDVLTRLKEGAWPTALYRLQNKQPVGFMTQELINQWIQKITNYMNSLS